MDFDVLIIDRSLDALLTAAALLSTHTMPESVRVRFTSASEVNTIPYDWPGRSGVVFVGPLAGKGGAPSRVDVTLREIWKRGHRVVGILDTDMQAWSKALATSLDLPDGADPLLDPLTSPALRLVPQAGWSRPDGRIFVGSAAEVLLDQARAELPPGALTLAAAAVAHKGGARSLLPRRALLNSYMEQGDDARRHLLRALAQNPFAIMRTHELAMLLASYHRAQKNHNALLDTAQKAGLSIYVHLDGASEVILPDLRDELLSRASLAVIQFSAGPASMFHVATREKLDLLVLAKDLRLLATGTPDAVDLSVLEGAELVRAARVALGDRSL